MTKLFMAALSLVIWTSPPAFAAMTDANFVARFTSYKVKKKTSTYKTAKIFANHLRQDPTKVLKRYLSTKFAHSKNGDATVVEGVEAFKEAGLSYEQALGAMSDVVGQLPETLNSIYSRSARRFASQY